MGCFDIGPKNPFGSSLVDCLIEVADGARQLYTDFGLRHIRVFLVWMTWTADEDGDGIISSAPDYRETDQTDLTAFAESDLEDGVVGVGRPVILQETELLPTPLVSPLGGVGKSQDAVGLTERGGLTVSQISMRYTEDFLMGLVSPFRDEASPDALKPNIDFFWELREDRGAGYVAPGYAACDAPAEFASPRRRFHVSGVPGRTPSSFEWSISLVRADGERDRDGQPVG